MYEWLVVGGGIHGTVLSIALLTAGDVDASSLRIVDPQPIMATWRRRTRACGMTHLRSPGAHGLEPDFASLRRWAGTRWRADTLGRYRRPSLELFSGYARSVVKRHGLEALRIASRANELRRSRGGNAWSVSVGDGTTVETRNVILAIGGDAGPSVPSWARHAPSARMMHIFDPGFRRESLLGSRRVTVVGGGASACQLALWLSKTCHVTLISRAPLRASEFDSNPCYVGPSCMTGFLNSPIEERAIALGENRFPGTVPPEILEEISRACGAGLIRHLVNPRIDMRNEVLAGAEWIVLATGLESDVSRDPLVSGARDSHSGYLLTDETGRPIPESDLTWAAGLYLTGRLAELELGPSAANIIGAQNAAKRIISSLHGAVRRIPRSWSSY